MPELYRTFAEGQQKHAPLPGLVCVLQDPTSLSIEETRRTAKAVFHIDGPFVIAKGHIGFGKDGPRKLHSGPLLYHPEGYMVFAHKELARQLNAA